MIHFQYQDHEIHLSDVKTQLPESLASGCNCDVDDVDIYKEEYLKGLQLAKQTATPQASMTKLQEIWAGISTLLLNQPNGETLQAVMKHIREMADAIVQS